MDWSILYYSKGKFSVRKKRVYPYSAVLPSPSTSLHSSPLIHTLLLSIHPPSPLSSLLSFPFSAPTYNYFPPYIFFFSLPPLFLLLSSFHFLMCYFWQFYIWAAITNLILRFAWSLTKSNLLQLANLVMWQLVVVVAAAEILRR